MIYNKKEPENSPILKRLIKEAVFPYKNKLILAIFFMIMVAISTAILAWLMDPVVNEIFINKDTELLWYVGFAVFSVFTVKGIATYVQAKIMAKVGQSILADMQKRLFSHLISQDLAFFQSQSIGSLVSRFTTDIVMMRRIVSTALTGLGKDVLSLFFLVLLMFYQDWFLATIAFIIFPLALMPITFLGKKIKKATALSQIETGNLLTFLQQAFVGIRMIKSYKMEEYQRIKVAEIIDKIKKHTIYADTIKAISSPLMETFGGVAVTTVILYGGWGVINGSTTAGAFFSFIAALIMAYRPMKSLAGIYAQMQEGLAGAERYFNIIDTHSSIKNSHTAILLDSKSSSINFKGVTFSYDEINSVVNNLNFFAESGKTTALVGKSGSGKTTILNLIARFFEVKSGVISINDQDISKLNLNFLRNSIAIITQDVIIFDDSIEQNILFGNYKANKEMLIEASKAAGVHDFIQKMPNGYKTIVGERGEKLSGGERQRIAIARAILKNARILLMDEATSSLDPSIEKKIQDAMRNLRKGRTTIIIAHRLETIKNADKIYVIDEGKVISSGTHSELLQTSSEYIKLYNLHYMK